MPRTPLHRAALVAAVALAALAGACAQDDPTEAELREDLTEELRDIDPELTADEAECYAELLVDEIGREEISDVDLQDEEPSAEIAEQLGAAAVAAREGCGPDGAISTTTAPPAGGDAVSTTTTAAP